MASLCVRWLAGAGLAVLLSFNASAQWVYPPGSSLDVPPGGTVDLSCVPLDMQGAMDLGSGGLLTMDSDATFGPAVAVTGTGGTISVGGDLNIAGALGLGNNSLELRDGCGAGNVSQLTGTLVVQNLTLRSTTGRTFVLPAGANITVLGTLRLEGVSGVPVMLQAASGTARINLGAGANVVRSNAAVPPTVLIGPTASVTSVPTLNHLGLLMLSALMGLAFWRQRRPAHF